MQRDNKSAHFHTKSWSYKYQCPSCGKSQRRNRNFLGAKFFLVCDGQKVKRTQYGEAVDYTVIVGNARGSVEVNVHNFPDDGEGRQMGARALRRAMERAIDSGEDFAKHSVVIRPKP